MSLDPPNISTLDLSPVSSLRQPSPALSHATVGSAVSDRYLQYDLSLATAVSYLVHRLIHPLSPAYPEQITSALRDRLSTILTELYRQTWDQRHPQRGSGYRSLICTKELGLPRILRQLAKELGVEKADWVAALASSAVDRDGVENVREEWEAWCDPGAVVWRYGPWEWEDVGYEPMPIQRERYQLIWQAQPVTSSAQVDPAQAAVITPARPSHAVPIRAPTVFQIPPTPAGPLANRDVLEDPLRAPSPNLLPAYSIASHSRTSSLGSLDMRSPSPASSGMSSDYEATTHSRASSHPAVVNTSFVNPPSHTAHKDNGSTSSIESSVSDVYSFSLTQLLTPGSRPGSADPFSGHPDRDGYRKTSTPSLMLLRGRTPSPNSPRDAMTPSTVTAATPGAMTAATTPIITPYDNGNVTVLGGGVKLGGSSRPASVMSTSRNPMDRSRSPSVSLASRALNTIIGPNANSNGTGFVDAPRKQRTRRRIMPTYLGHLGQPGVGGPVGGVFGQFAGKVQQPTMYGGGWHHQPGMGVGIGMPQAGIAGMRAMPRLGS